MKKSYFPQWYIESKENKEIRFYKAFNAILIITVLVVATITLKNLNTYKELIVKNEKAVNSSEVETNNFITLKSFKAINKNLLNSNLKIHNMTLKDNIANFIINVNDNKEYLESIKYLEEYGEIISVTNIVEKDNTKYFEVKVKINYES